MKNHLQLIAESYDKAVDYGRKGIDLYKSLPAHITGNPDYLKWQKEVEKGPGGSENKAIKDYLSPDRDMKFVDLGCSLNLMFHGYHEWPSTYYGVDISVKTTQLLREYAAKRDILVGSLHCGSIDQTPFEDNCFDIGACIGVLEYFAKDYVEKAIMEAHRILKPGGRFVLDIPNTASPGGRIMMMIEEHMGRPDLFDLPPDKFEKMLTGYFEIAAKDRSDQESMGLMYYLRCIK